MRTGLLETGIAVAILGMQPTLAAESLDANVGQRLSQWTKVAVAIEPTPPSPQNYRLEWQRELLAFQLSYSKRLVKEQMTSIDPIETGSINKYR